MPLFSTDWLPAVWPSFGVWPVSPEIILIRASGRSSSSAAIWASAVRMPWPSSTLPVKTVAVPSALMRIQPSSLRLFCRLPGSRGGVLAERALRIEREGDDDRAEPGGEFTSIDGGSVHGQVLPFAWAARSTARMIRLWVPQRQRLPSSAARTSCSLGRGLRSSSSFADMIMPLVQ